MIRMPRVPRENPWYYMARPMAAAICKGVYCNLHLLTTRQTDLWFRRLHNTGLTWRHNQPGLFATRNYVHDNGDAGMTMMESFNADVSDNIFENNKYGIRLSVGCGRNVFSNNVISGSTK